VLCTDIMCYHNESGILNELLYYLSIVTSDHPPFRICSVSVFGPPKHRSGIYWLYTSVLTSGTVQSIQDESFWDVEGMYQNHPARTVHMKATVYIHNEDGPELIQDIHVDALDVHLKHINGKLQLACAMVDPAEVAWISNIQKPSTRWHG
jgi:hypothetical protein